MEKEGRDEFAGIAPKGSHQSRQVINAPIPLKYRPGPEGRQRFTHRKAAHPPAKPGLFGPSLSEQFDPMHHWAIRGGRQMRLATDIGRGDEVRIAGGEAGQLVRL